MEEGSKEEYLSQIKPLNGTATIISIGANPSWVNDAHQNKLEYILGNVGITKSQCKQKQGGKCESYLEREKAKITIINKRIRDIIKDVPVNLPYHPHVVYSKCDISYSNDRILGRVIGKGSEQEQLREYLEGL